MKLSMSMFSTKPVKLASLILIIYITTVSILKFNHFVELQEDVLAKGGNLEASYQYRLNLFENLLKLTLSYAILEQRVNIRVADVRKDIISKLKLPSKIQQSLMTSVGSETGLDLPQLKTELSTIQGLEMEDTMGSLLGVIEKYPNIKSSEIYRHMMTSLVELEDLIIDRRTIYQESMRLFNREISGFPWKLLAMLTNFKRFEYFEAPSNANYRMQIQAENYERLLPDKQKPETTKESEN